MSRTVTTFLGVLACLTCFAGSALAVKYPPGPSGTCTDSLRVRNLQNPAEVCHPVAPDSVYGVGGIVTGFDSFSPGFAFYLQNRATGANSAPWTGIDIFTGAVNYLGTLARGDSVVVYGRMAEFAGESEMLGFNNSFSTDIIVRKITSGIALPPFHVGTVNELQELPSNPNAEQWEGVLVRVNGPMRVVRNSDTGGMGQGHAFLVVDNIVCPTGSVGPCDSLFVDGETLANPAFAPPAVGTLVDRVQGIYNERGRGFRIQLRDGNDIIAATPPNLSDAYPVHDDTLRLVFDRDVTVASAENENNYSLASFGTIVHATRVEGNAVHLAISNGLSDGDNETVTAANIAGQANGLPMASPQSRAFINGVLTVNALQMPNPDSLLASPCVDKSRFAGGGSAAGPRLTFRGIVAGIFGTVYYMVDPAGGARSGVGMFSPIAPMVRGRQYLVAGGVQEFFTETEGTNNVYIRDEGAATIPAPSLNPIGVYTNADCDVTQSLLNAEDFEGCLVKLQKARITENRNAGESFFVAADKPSYGDTILVADRNNVLTTFNPDSLNSVDVTAILGIFNDFRLNPRNDADIVSLGPLGVTPGMPREVKFSVYPNPGEFPKVSFSLPQANQVEVAVYDIVGRKVADIAKGTFPAGTHTRAWNGRDSRGNPVTAGVYFYRLKVGSEIRNIRGIRLD